MIDTILVPLDGSELAEQALATARALALRYDAGLVLAHVHEPSEPIVLDDMPAIDEQLQSLTRRHEQTYLERAAQHVAPDGRPPVKVALLEGPVSRALSDCAEQYGADLIVITTHGRTGFERAWLGSVTDALSRSSSTPLLVLRPGGAMADGFGRIVVPLDGSAEGERVLPVVRELADSKSSILLLRVVPANADAAERERAASYLDTVAGRLRDGEIEIATDVRDGAAAPVILETAREQGADLIALSAHGHGGFMELLVGSNADKVLRAAEVPVLLVRR